MSHPFGDLLAQYLHRKHGLSQSKLAGGIYQAPSVITEMCKGKRLSGAQARERVLAIIDWLLQQEALSTQADANALLDAAGMSALHAGDAAEARLVARLAGQPALEPFVPATQVMHRPIHHHNLPAQVTSFVGHEGELSDLRRLLVTGGARLLTLTGSGGVGKTRLALQLAAQVAEAFRDGVWLVELAPLADPALVPQAVATVLGVHEAPGCPLPATLVDHLRDQQLLLVLDNCEHLIEAAARLADELLRGCRSLWILATSREGLGNGGEQVWRVRSLQAPDRYGSIETAELATFEAVRLFEERARLAWPHFSLSEDNALAVQQICVRLDGIPLALELAAARLRMMTVEDIAARLDDRFHLLTSGDRVAAPRQRTLRAAIDWSYELLSEAERVLLRRLAVFAGGWTLAAAEVVGSGAGIEPAEVFSLLASLVSKSLVNALTDVDGVAGLTRYNVLETLRQYALEKLQAAGEEMRVRDRHLAYYIAHGKEVAALWSEPDPGDLASQANRLTLDLDNLRHALDWAAESGQVDDGVRLIEAFWQTLFVVRAVDLELLRRLQGLVAHPAAQRSAQLGHAYLMLWELYFAQGDLEQAREVNEQAREIGLALGEAHILAIADYQLALQAQERGEYMLARSIFDRLQAAGESVREEWPQIYGILALYEGDYKQACECLVQHYALTQSHTFNKVQWSGAARLSGYALAYLGDYAEATIKLRESLVENWKMSDARAVAASLAAFGVLARLQGEWPRAARLFGAAAGSIESIHDFLQPWDQEQVRRNVAALRAQLDEATFNAEWAVGRAMTLERSIEYALAV